MIDEATVEAGRFFERHQAERETNPEHLLDRCAQHLSEHFMLTTSAALQISMSVLSEIESAGAEGYIDHERSSSRMVLVRDALRRTVHMVSAGELLRLVRLRSLRDSPPRTG